MALLTAVSERHFKSKLTCVNETTNDSQLTGHDEHPAVLPAITTYGKQERANLLETFTGLECC